MGYKRIIAKKLAGIAGKGLVSGAVGGLVASFVMNQFQSFVGKRLAGKSRSHGAQSLQSGLPTHGIGRELQERGRDDRRDDATMRLANAISTFVFDHRLTKSEKHIAGAALHYAYGISTGAAYGVVAEFLPTVTVGEGMPYGALVWVTADEGVVPALGLSKSPTEYPLSVHLYAFSSHLVYGLTNEVVRRLVRTNL
jgi:hypothetical protein